MRPGEHPDLIRDTFTREIVGRNAIERRAKGGERAHHARGVFGRRIDPQIEITGGARTAVQREGVCPHDEKADVSGDERAQQIDKVRVHRAGRLAAARVPG